MHRAQNFSHHGSIQPLEAALFHAAYASENYEGRPGMAEILPLRHLAERFERLVVEHFEERWVAGSRHAIEQQQALIAVGPGNRMKERDEKGPPESGW